jgi:sec-independent protein translocase protein TatA
MALSLRARPAGCSFSRGSSANVVSARPGVNRVCVPARRAVCAPNRRDSIVCNGLFGLGLPEIAVIAGVAAVIWGPSKLPELGKGLGKTLKSFQSAAKEFESELKTATSDDVPPVTEQPKAEAKPEADKTKA